MLIVEDNKVNLRLLQKLLKNEGYTYESAEDGIIALNKMETEIFHAIIMDIEMPNMNGLEATIAIRKKEINSQKSAIPIIGLSGNAREEQLKEAIENGMNAYLTKPLDKKLLFITLQKFLNQDTVLLPATTDFMRVQTNPEALGMSNDEQKGKETDSPSLLLESLQTRLNKSDNSYTTRPTTASSHDSTTDLSGFQHAYNNFTLSSSSSPDNKTKNIPANADNKSLLNF